MIMLCYISSSWKRRALLAAVAVLWLIPARGQAEPKPGKQDRRVIEMVIAYVHQAHLTRPEIDDKLSKRLFQRYLNDLDSAKLYFLKEDVDEFKKQETELDDQLLRGNVTFAYEVYERFLTRLTERQKLIEELVNAPHDFTVKEYLDSDTDKIDYAKDEAELKERWRKRIKFDLLLQRLGTKPVGDAEAKKKVLTRYQGAVKRWKQLDNYDLLEIYLSDLTTSVDPHSTYMSPGTLDDFDIAMRLNLEGIGAVLRSENGQTIITEVVPGGAAAKDGRLKVNDKIVGVAQGDGKFTEVVDMKLREVVKLIRGRRGTTVELRIVPAEKVEPVVVTLKREKIQLKDQEARSEIIEQGKKPDGKPYRIGVIDLPSFYMDMKGRGRSKSATEDVRKILRDFKAKDIDGVVLDLRHNGGGALTEALALTGLFIDRGP
ncbi:MAG TPA: S41 family peptidase, partial [Gemmataceae bacterium]|nr:S41 family peptidase [Gemmataceae bacterium]